MTDELPPPIEQVDDDDAMQSVFGDDGPSDATPLGAAFLWYSAVLNRDDPQQLEDARTLSYRASDWGDYSEEAARMQGWSVMQNVEQPPTGETDIAYVKLLRADTSGRSFGNFKINPADAQWITLVEAAPGVWRVWGISPGNYRPSAKRVNTGED